jgi:hypothetical protein
MTKLLTTADVAKLERKKPVPGVRTPGPDALQPKHKKSEFRTTGPDVLQPVNKKPEDSPGTLHHHHIPIYDHKGQHRGHVGPKATAATVARFTGQHGSKLVKRDGKDAWISPPPPPPKPEQVDPTAVAVAAQNVQGKIAIAEHQSQAKHKLAIELNQAKGSVTKTPSKPKTSARPKRG